MTSDGGGEVLQWTRIPNIATSYSSEAAVITDLVKLSRECTTPTAVYGRRTVMRRASAYKMAASDSSQILHTSLLL